MAKSILSKRKADAISNGAFFIGLGILLFTNAWWPGILIVLWIALVLRQYLTGRNYDAVLSTIILVGLFLISYVKIDWSVLIPVLFVIGGIYLIFREYFYAEETIEKETDIND
jgi:predicted membrane protein